MNLKTKKMFWLIAGIAGIVAVAGLLRGFRKKPEKATFHEEKATKSKFLETVIATGTVSPENRLVIKPPIAGRVEEILVREGQRVAKGRLLAWVSTTERAALLDSARAEGETELERWKNFYKATPIYAPIDGMIILRSLEPGQSFNAGEGILVMSDRLTIKAQVDETSIAKVKPKQKARIVLDAYPEEKITGSVVHIGFDARTVNNVTGYVVDVLPENAPPHMLSGMTANVMFILKELEDAITIPSEALQSQDGQACVRQKTSDDPLKDPCVPVKTGPANEKRTVIVEGLADQQAIWVPDLKPVEFKAGSLPKNPFSPIGSGRMRH